VGAAIERFVDDAAEPAVRGWLHGPGTPAGDALVLSHGAGSNCDARLLVEVAGDPVRDREGLRRAVEAARRFAPGRVFLGGHSYGGRQATILASDDPALTQRLLLLSYPLHPPRRPSELRTGHFPRLRAPTLFVHGTKDPFGSIEEMRAALALIPAQVQLVSIEGAGHDLSRAGVAQRVLEAFQKFVR